MPRIGVARQVDLADARRSYVCKTNVAAQQSLKVPGTQQIDPATC